VIRRSPSFLPARPVTPEVAGSSPVAPVTPLQIGVLCCLIRRGRPPASDDPAHINGTARRSAPGLARGRPRASWLPPPNLAARARLWVASRQGRREASRRQSGGQYKDPVGNQRRGEGSVGRHAASFVYQAGRIAWRGTPPGCGQVYGRRQLHELHLRNDDSDPLDGLTNNGLTPLFSALKLLPNAIARSPKEPLL
jgi:hypothetical protein